jgi:regulator of CtrA degradation
MALEHDQKPAEACAEPISLASRLPGSEGFKALFREGMGLIEEAAAYLDGPGREASRGLSRTGSLAYATESMRLTTRLMQVASWLLLQRAVHEGEMSQDQARQDKFRVKIEPPNKEGRRAGFEELPETLRSLIDRAAHLQGRVHHLDRMFRQDAAAPPQESAVADQIDRLRAAFGGPE